MPAEGRRSPGEGTAGGRRGPAHWDEGGRPVVAGEGWGRGRAERAAAGRRGGGEAGVRRAAHERAQVPSSNEVFIGVPTAEKKATRRKGPALPRRMSSLRGVRPVREIKSRRWKTSESSRGPSRHQEAPTTAWRRTIRESPRTKRTLASICCRSAPSERRMAMSR